MPKRFNYSWPVLFGLFIGLYFVAFNIVGVDFEYFPGDLGDARFNNYILEHGYRYLAGLESEYWNAPFCYPEQNIISYSDNLIGTVPIYSFFREIGADRILSFQLWFVLLCALNYLSAFYLLRYLFRNDYAAVLGAYVFAFGLGIQSQLTHAQTFPRFMIPLAILMALMFLKKLEWKYFLAAMLCLVMQFYCGLYLGFMLAIPLFILLFYGVFIANWKQLKVHAVQWKWTAVILSSILLAILILMPLIGPYMDRSREITEITYASVVDSLPTLKSFFFSQHGTVFWDGLEHTGQQYPEWWNHQLFPGGLALLCLLLLPFLLFFRKKFQFNWDKRHWSFSIAAVITFLVFFRVQGHSLYKYIFDIPGFGSMRALGRIINVELLFFAFAVSAVFTAVFNKLKWKIVPFILVFVLLVMDNYTKLNWSYRTRKSQAIERSEPIRQQLKQVDKKVIVSYEPEILKEAGSLYQLDMMVAAQDFGLKTLNGYTARAPKNYHYFWAAPNEKHRSIWLNRFESFNDSVVVIH